MYVDESGDCGLTGSPTRHFILCGLVVHELRWEPFRRQLLAFRRRMRDAFSPKLREEIHALHMITRPGPLVRIAKHDRLAILRHLVDELTSMDGLNVISVVVDKQGKAADYDVFANAWRSLIQRFENTVDRRNFAGPANPDERGAVYPDHPDDKKIVRLLRRVRSYNAVARQKRKAAGIGRGVPATRRGGRVSSAGLAATIYDGRALRLCGCRLSLRGESSPAASPPAWRSEGRAHRAGPARTPPPRRPSHRAVAAG